MPPAPARASGSSVAGLSRMSSSPVPATQRYSYAWLGGRANLVDPASGVVVADLSE